MSDQARQPTDIDFGEIVERDLPDWSVERPNPGDPTGPVWVHAHHRDGQPVPDQGWKLHISATITNAPEVLDRVLGVLAPTRTQFKVAWHGAFLARLNSGLEGASQAGKFVTIYPATDAVAVELARSLVDATDGMAAPKVPSDRRIGTSPVHYRYGAFASVAIQNMLGQPEPALVGPDGTAEPDHRGTTYRKPTWADDPFEAAGIATAEAGPDQRIIDRRFLRLAPIVVGARGGVHHGIDLLEGSRVVLKSAHTDASVAADGSDASDRLRNEAEVLRRLSADAGAPAFVASGTWDGEDYLAMEEIVGRSASWHIQDAQVHGRRIDQATARRWAIDVATTLRALHDQGLVFRDLKIANLMIEHTTGRARLVDFELATPVGSSGQGGAGSRGYRPPPDGRPEVAFTDDIFGFGALLWAFTTTNEPSFQPADDDLDRLDPQSLNPDADPDLVALSRRCRAIEPIDRPATIAEVLVELDSSPPQSTTPARRRRDDIDTAEDWDAYAVRAGRALVERATSVDGFAYWPSVRRVGGGMALRTVYEGSAGIALAFAELVAAGRDEFAQPLRDTVRWLTHGDDRIDHVPGLLSGEMGVAVAIAVAGDVLADRALITQGIEMGLAVHADATAGPDYVMGSAGIARGHLVLARLGADTDHRSRALTIGRDLVDIARTDDDGAHWLLPAAMPRLGGLPCYGYGHGAAGIADVLFDLATAFDDDSFSATADAALDWIAAAALGRPAGIDWAETPTTDPFGGWWCHGAGGIAMAMARANRSDLARRAAHHTARMTWALPNRCHGLAGNIEVLLAVDRLLAGNEFSGDAANLGRLLAGWEIAPGIWPGESADIVTPDYMVGFAGVIPAFLRLAGHVAVDPTFMPLAGPLA